MEEEILVRVPPLSLLRFRSVCKEWNTLINNNRFVNKNFACGRPELMLNTHSHIYSISFNLNDDPTIKVRDLCFRLSVDRYHHYGMCDGYFFFMGNYDDKGYVAWNPMLRHKRITRKECRVSGIRVGYDVSRPEKSYKIKIFSVSEHETNAWKVTDDTSFNRNSMLEGILYHNVFLNRNLYWIAYTYPETGKYYIQILDHSKEIIKTFCILPCKGETSSSHTRVLAIYKGDRFSVLEQCKRTRQIEIWVTKNKIGNGDDGDNVVWIKFMTFSIPDFPMVLIHKSTSYFVDNNIYGKSFVYCCHNKELQQVWVYIVKGDDLCKKIKIDEVVCVFQSSVYVPSLITIS